MSISTYGELKTAVANFLDRTDLIDRIPEFISLAHARIHFGSDEPPLQSDPLRIRAMETSQDLTISGQSVAIPSGVIQTKRIYLNTNPPAKLSYVAPEIFWGTGLNGGSGPPSAFTIEGENYLFGPTPDATYTGKLLSWNSFTALSNDLDTNWLLTNSPGAYLNGALIEGFDYLFDPKSKLNAYSKFVGIINALNKSDKRDRFSGSVWVARTDTGNP